MLKTQTDSFLFILYEETETVLNRDEGLHILLLRHDNVTTDCLIHMFLLTKKSNQGDLSIVHHESIHFIRL